MEGKARPLLDYLKKKESEAVVLAKLIYRMDDRDKFMTGLLKLIYIIFITFYLIKTYLY
jgi:hypothetical protein